MQYVIENEYLRTMACFRTPNKKEQLDKLEKLITIIEDKVLKKKIKNYIEAVGILPDETQLKMYKDDEKSKKLIKALQAKRELQGYLEKVVEGKKPYWQIIAEQNGWSPKGE